VTLALFGALWTVSAAQSDYPRRAQAILLMPSQAYRSVGTINFTQSAAGSSIQITGTLQIPPGASQIRGFHIHEFGIISPDCVAAGTHYNPYKQVHGSLNDSRPRHIGDLGNVQVDNFGNVNVNINVPDEKLMPLSGAYSVIGRTLVIHEKADDLGLGGAPESNTTGNAGGRIACGVIGIASPNYSGAAGPAMLLSPILLGLTLAFAFARSH